MATFAELNDHPFEILNQKLEKSLLRSLELETKLKAANEELARCRCLEKSQSKKRKLATQDLNLPVTSNPPIDQNSMLLESQLKEAIDELNAQKSKLEQLLALKLEIEIESETISESNVILRNQVYPSNSINVVPDSTEDSIDTEKLAENVEAYLKNHNISYVTLAKSWAAAASARTVSSSC
jgi:hypothetical protein